MYPPVPGSIRHLARPRRCSSIPRHATGAGSSASTGSARPANAAWATGHDTPANLPGQNFGWISQRRASPSMAATSASVSAKPNRSMFAAIRSWRADFGITVMPCSRCQRSTT
jgi:hypothetical protein